MTRLVGRISQRRNPPICAGKGGGLRCANPPCATRRANQQKPVQPFLQKYSDFQKSQITFISLTVLSHWRGGSRSSRMRDRMRWTQGAPTTRALFLADGEAVWSCSPALISSGGKPEKCPSNKGFSQYPRKRPSVVETAQAPNGPRSRNGRALRQGNTG
jgi:hypothetical protein